jgi:MFS family permease
MFAIVIREINKINMIQKIVYRFIKPRHFWRTASFSELSEIYTSMMMRSLGFSLMGIFVPVFLYTNGVSLQNIFLFFVYFFLLRVPVSFFSGFVIARIGPKHSIAVSTILLIGFLSLLLTYNQLIWPLFILALFFTLSNGLFFIAYDTDFSKIKHAEHGGKELSYLYIFERLGGALGPLIGGIVASVFVPEITIILALVVLIGSIIPLMLTNEPVRLHQQITFRGFAWKRHTRDYISIAALNVEHALSTILWPLFVTVLVFEGNIYAKLGAIVALGMTVSMVTARFYGRVIDTKHGATLLSYGACANAFTHLLRPFINSAGGVVLMSAASEPVALASRMPLAKGYFDAGDVEKGYRIIYFTVSQMVTSSFKCAVFLLLYLLAPFVSVRGLFVVGFIIAALASVIVLVQQFPALKRV